MVADPLAEFDGEAELADSATSVYESISAAALEVPREDWGLFEQLRGDPRLTSIIDEIAFHRYLRIKLTRELMKSADEDERTDLIDAIRDIARKYGMEEEDLAKFRMAVDKKVPPAQLSLSHIRALSKLLETSGKLAEQQKKIIDGTEIKVNVTGDILIQQLFTHVIRPSVDEACWAVIRDRARKFAPLLGSSQVLDLDASLD